MVPEKNVINTYLHAKSRLDFPFLSPSNHQKPFAIHQHRIQSTANENVNISAPVNAPQSAVTLAFHIEYTGGGSHISGLLARHTGSMGGVRAR